MAKKSAPEPEVEENEETATDREEYDPDLDVILASEVLGGAYTACVRQYGSTGVPKLVIMRARKKKPPYAEKRLPMEYAAKLLEVLPKLIKAGAKK